MVVARELAVPFRVDPSGSFGVMTSPGDVANAHVLTVVSTALRERVMNSSFGCKLLDYSFKSLTDDMITTIRQEISQAITQWVPEVELIDIRAKVDEADAQLSLDIEYKLTNNISRVTQVSIPVSGFGSN